MAAPHPPFGSRSAYAGAGSKLPERPNPLPFSASAFSRNRGVLGGVNTNNIINNNTESAQQPQPQPQPQQHLAQQQPPIPSQHSQNHAAAATMMGNDAGSGGGANPLSRLTEEQREEINEAVQTPTSIHLSYNHLNNELILSA
ncbi:hypothetical protein EIK77_008752 [Talaromyces pinophilus]|nr:hypothetical protein EIK77_008752 [Talaromyces pinophilus]